MHTTSILLALELHFAAFIVSNMQLVGELWLAFVVRND